MRNDDENVAQTTASDLRAVAQDMLRMGRHWARAAQDWLERAGDEAQRQARTRSDRDLQSDYSTGGYDQVDTGRGSSAYGSQAYGSHAYGTQAYGAQAYGAYSDSYPGGRDFGGRDYRGVGPRNYTRSDDRIREDLNERLTEAYDLDASGLAVEVENGVATLTGNVPQRWMKHRAEDLADGCIGVRDVRNHIMVGSGSSSVSDAYGSSAGSMGTGTGASTATRDMGSTGAGAAGNVGSTGNAGNTTTGTAGTNTGYAGSTGKETP